MKRLIKLLSVALCLTLVLSASLVGVFALSLSGVTIGSKDSDTATADEAALYKDETVYVMAKADGSVDKVIVSDWIRNNDKAGTITDVSSVGDMENVKTDASFTINSDGMRVWEAQGEDLYLQGTGTQELPVDLNVTYTLDGKVVTPEEIAGKSGRVTIRFDYTNNQYEKVKIDGKEENIYVPFLMLSGLMLDGDSFSNVSVTGGKVVSDGDRIMVAGIAFPGLQHDLGLSKDDISIPDYFEVSADTTDFSLGTTVTIATNGLLNEVDTDSLDSLDELKSSMNKLTDAMTKLIDGSSALYTGLETLLEKSSELSTGVDKLYDGAVQLSDGAEKLNSGAEKLSDGAANLSNGSVSVDLGSLKLMSGLSTLDENSSALNNGSDLTFTSILATATKSIKEAGFEIPDLTEDNYNKVLEGLLENISDKNVKALAESKARATVTEKVEAQRDAVVAGVTEAVRQNVKAQVESGVKAKVYEQVLAALGYTAADYEAAVEAGMVDEATQAQINSAVEAQLASAEVQATVDALTEQNMQAETAQTAIEVNTQAKIDELIEENMQGEEVQEAISEALESAKAGRTTIKNLEDQLDSYKEFNTGLKTYTGGVSSASAGASQLYSGTTQLKSGAAALSSGASDLKDGTQSLSSGADTLKNGVLTLKNGVPALIDGVSQLKDGSMQLSDGLKQLNDEGISKITSLFEGKLSTLSERVKAMAEVSKNYKSYSGLTDEMDGEVKFIYKTEEIKK